MNFKGTQKYPNHPKVNVMTGDNSLLLIIGKKRNLPWD